MVAANRTVYNGRARLVAITGLRMGEHGVYVDSIGNRTIWTSGIDARPDPGSIFLSNIDSPRFSPDGAGIYFSVLADGK